MTLCLQSLLVLVRMRTQERVQNVWMLNWLMTDVTWCKEAASAYLLCLGSGKQKCLVFTIPVTTSQLESAWEKRWGILCQETIDSTDWTSNCKQIPFRRIDFERLFIHAPLHFPICCLWSGQIIRGRPRAGAGWQVGDVVIMMVMMLWHGDVTRSLCRSLWVRRKWWIKIRITFLSPCKLAGSTICQSLTQANNNLRGWSPPLSPRGASVTMLNILTPCCRSGLSKFNFPVWTSVIVVCCAPRQWGLS